jgi:hypothetical protein
MKEDTIKGIQVAANLAIIVAAVLLCAVLIKDYIIARPGSAENPLLRASNLIGSPNRTRPPAESQIQPGTRINLPGVDWAKNGQTLLLAVSDKCHFCSESAPFYQRLAHDHGKTRLLAVLPQPVEDGEKYLDSLKVTVDDVKQASFSSLGVRGTPTLILVDKNGVAINSWVGKLSDAREAEVLSRLMQL